MVLNFQRGPLVFPKRSLLYLLIRIRIKSRIIKPFHINNIRAFCRYIQIRIFTLAPTVVSSGLNHLIEI